MILPHFFRLMDRDEGNGAVRGTVAVRRASRQKKLSFADCDSPLQASPLIQLWHKERGMPASSEVWASPVT